MSDIDYVKMLEIPVSSTDVVYKPVRKKKGVKKKVIEKVNESITAEKMQSDNQIKKIKTRKKTPSKLKEENQIEKSVEIKSSSFDIVSVQVVAIFVLIVGIILTNIFWENSGINNLMRSVFKKEETTLELTYSDFSAGLPSKTQEVVLTDGVMTVESGSVYSPCDGVIESITQTDGKYTVTVKHSEFFSTVVDGLEHVYSSVGEKVYSNLPMGYSSGSTSVCMYDGDSMLTSYVLSENQIVWLG